MLNYSIKDGVALNVTAKEGEWIFHYPCGTNNSVCSPYEVTFAPGQYRLKVCGGQGGRVSVDSMRGGCSYGIIKLHKRTDFLLYVAGRGTDSPIIDSNTKPGGYNGGGRTTYGAASGAGSSDVRLNETLESRIIVGAGSGGGNDDYPGGAGGGLNGTKGYGTRIYNGVECIGGDGGTQDAGGDGQFPGGFGFGGGDSPTHKSFGGGGGSGWYGGAGGLGVIAAGGGGSSYISGHPDCIPSPTGFEFEKPKTKSDMKTGDGEISVVVWGITSVKKAHDKKARLLAAIFLL